MKELIFSNGEFFVDTSMFIGIVSLWLVFSGGVFFLFTKKKSFEIEYNVGVGIYVLLMLVAGCLVILINIEMIGPLKDKVIKKYDQIIDIGEGDSVIVRLVGNKVLKVIDLEGTENLLDCESLHYDNCVNKFKE